MAETVLSMARSLVGNAITKAGEAAAAEISLLIDELKTMQAFLMTAEEMEKKPRLLKAWVEQVRDLSFDIEDCLAEFMVHVGSKSLSQQLMKLKHRHRIAIQIRDLKSRVEEVSDRNSRYSLISPNTDEHDTLRDEFRYWSAKNIDEAELVGFDDAKESILNLIDVHANHGLAKVIFVVGMGGLGKTSLVKKVYHSINIVNNFSCRAWVTVSQSFVRTELLRGLIKQLLGGDSENEHFKGLQSMQRNEKVEDLVEDLKQGLKEKRYFVVLDDMWSIDALNWLNESVFPDSNNGGSRIIVTTRDASIIQNCAYPSYLYRLEPLKTDDAKQLLLRKSNKSYEDIKEARLRSIFPEDFPIKRRCMVNRWIAEGFVDAKFGMAMEDVGNSYFDELINRSMIQPSETNPRRWWRSSARVSVPKGIGSLKELQILELVDIARSNKKAVHELGELTQLKKLGVAGVTERNVSYLCEALQKLSSLCSLRVEAKPFRGLHMLEQLASPPPFLHTLKLKGSLHEIPSWVGKLEKLVKVQLVFTKLKDTESIQVLGELPGLKCLRLILNAYIGKELVLCHGKFRGLKTLRLDSLEELRKVTFEERTSPKLETITIQDCSSELAVCGTANLQSLEKIKYFAKGKLVKRPVVQAGQSQSAHHREDIKAAEIIEKSQTSSLEKGESSQSIPRPDVLRTLPPISATTKLKRSLSCPASTSIVM
ncbi:hypothetical protein OsJ_21012 [Oryza sativa Japonica Group]|uniref:Uncharacterized protein n=1 Tax=Oryza sativa subsp. japonica TaxID=39947 RepID=B9FST1_ORYSJ|nr:hypothetical protein OsJ_21012 [Oryza sativa Japonica Group]